MSISDDLRDFLPSNYSKDNASDFERTVNDAANLIEKLETENAELKRDSERLDFLLDNKNIGIYFSNGKYHTYFNFKNYCGDTKRQVIDEAMKNGG